MGDTNLAGHCVLIVEPEIGQFAHRLQVALEQTGADTLIVRGPAAALERLQSFRFSACTINYDHATDALRTLIGVLESVPILLYGNEAATAQSARTLPHLTFAPADVCSIVSALSRLLQPAGD